MCEDPEPRGPRDVKQEKMEDIFMVQKIREGIPGKGSLLATNWSLSENCCLVQAVISTPQITCRQQHNLDLETEGPKLEREAVSPQETRL